MRMARFSERKKCKGKSDATEILPVILWKVLAIVFAGDQNLVINGIMPVYPVNKIEGFIGVIDSYPGNIDDKVLQKRK